MKEDSADELKKKLLEERAKNERLQKELSEFIRAEECLVAAGIVTQEKVKKAHELVQTFSR